MGVLLSMIRSCRALTVCIYGYWLCIFCVELKLSILWFCFPEVASDYGGPRKEFLQLYLREASEKLIHQRTLVENSAYLTARQYYCLGVVMGVYVKYVPFGLCCFAFEAS